MCLLTADWLRVDKIRTTAACMVYDKNSTNRNKGTGSAQTSVRIKTN